MTSRKPDGNEEPEDELTGTDEAPDRESRGLEPVSPSEAEPISPELLERLRTERDALQDQLLRKRAELENFRKRVERDRSQQHLAATAAIVKALLPSLDNLDRALSADATDESLREGVELIRRDLMVLLESEGLRVLDPEGESFDPETQQALVHEAVPGFEDGIIVEVFRKGYKLKDRLLRPALVRVAKGQDQTDEPDPEAVH